MMFTENLLCQYQDHIFLVSLPNTCEAYNKNIYIPATVDLTNNDQTLTLQKWFLGFTQTYMNITYWIYAVSKYK